MGASREECAPSAPPESSDPSSDRDFWTSDGRRAPYRQPFRCRVGRRPFRPRAAAVGAPCSQPSRNGVEAVSKQAFALACRPSLNCSWRVGRKDLRSGTGVKPPAGSNQSKGLRRAVSSRLPRAGYPSAKSRASLR
jgi:hypothetical protein